MAKNDVEAEFIRKRELIMEKISVLKNQQMSLNDFYKCTNDIIFEEEEVESELYITKKRKKEVLETRISSASFYKNSSSL